jgi:chemotaxis protein methyltransferase WspC
MTALQSIASLAAAAGIEPTLATASALAPLAEERRRCRGARDLNAYAELVEREPTELAALLRLVTVPETWAYRYPASFEWLRGFIAARPGRPFRALSVPCATGTEPLTIAAAALSCGLAPALVTVLAIDASPEAIEAATEARFGSLAVRGGLPPWSAPWLSTDGSGRLHADAVTHACVEFRLGAAPDALRVLPAASFDAVFCRNLAIYLADAPRRAIGQELDRVLAPDGALFLGHAERPSHFGLERGFTGSTPEDPSTFAFVRRAARAMPEAAPIPTLPTGPARAPRTAPPAPRAGGNHPAPASAPRPALDEARAAADRGHLAHALELAERLRSGGDARIELLELLGTIHMALGNDARAEEVLRQAVYLDPANAEALIQLGVLAERRGDAAMSARYRARAAGSRA